MKRCTKCALRYLSVDDEFCAQCGGRLLTVTFFERNQNAIVAMVIVGSFILLIAIGRALNNNMRPPPRLTTRNANTRPVLTEHPSPSPKLIRWGYSEHTDEMGRGRVYINMIASTNTISLDSPYQGPQHGTLTIREHPQHGRDVYVRIERGQLLDSDYHGEVLVRFDSDKPISFPSVRPDDLSSETLFLRGNAFSVFQNRLKTARTLKIEVPIYQAGNQVLEFDVEGFTWKETQSVPKNPTSKE